MDRTLQELHLLGLLVVDDVPYGEKVRWIYSLGDVSRDALARLTRNVSTHGPQAQALRDLTESAAAG